MPYIFGKTYPIMLAICSIKAANIIGLRPYRSLNPPPVQLTIIPNSGCSATTSIGSMIEPSNLSNKYKSKKAES